MNKNTIFIWKSTLKKAKDELSLKYDMSDPSFHWDDPIYTLDLSSLDARQLSIAKSILNGSEGYLRWTTQTTVNADAFAIASLIKSAKKLGFKLESLGETPASTLVSEILEKASPNLPVVWEHLQEDWPKIQERRRRKEEEEKKRKEEERRRREEEKRRERELQEKKEKGYFPEGGPSKPIEVEEQRLALSDATTALSARREGFSGGLVLLKRAKGKLKITAKNHGLDISEILKSHSKLEGSLKDLIKVFNNSISLMEKELVQIYQQQNRPRWMMASDMSKEAGFLSSISKGVKKFWKGFKKFLKGLGEGMHQMSVLNSIVSLYTSILSALNREDILFDEMKLAIRQEMSKSKDKSWDSVYLAYSTIAREIKKPIRDARSCVRAARRLTYPT